MWSALFKLVQGTFRYGFENSHSLASKSGVTLRFFSDSHTFSFRRILAPPPLSDRSAVHVTLPFFHFIGIILSAFFYGYLVLQIPGGWLALRIGAKRVLGYSILIASAIHTSLPILARYNCTLFVIARVLQGLALVSMRFSLNNFLSSLKKTRSFRFTSKNSIRTNFNFEFHQNYASVFSYSI